MLTYRFIRSFSLFCALLLIATMLSGIAVSHLGSDQLKFQEVPLPSVGCDPYSSSISVPSGSVFGYEVKGYTNPYKSGRFNPGDSNKNRIEDVLEERLDGLDPGEMVECYVLLSTDDSLFDFDALERAGAEVVLIHSYIDQVLIRARVEQLQRIALLPDVAEVCDKPITRTLLNSSVSALGMNDVYSTGFTGDGTTIAVLDTGIDGDHECFRNGKIRAFEDFTYAHWPYHQTTQPYDDDGHGTHCASIAAGNPPAGGSSGGRYRGVAYEADLLICRVMGASVMGYVVAAVDWVVAQRNTYGVEVMSLSIGTVNDQGYPSHSDSMNSACNDAIGFNIVVCAAAGNDGEEGWAMGSPADAPNVLTVGSCNDWGQTSSFSTRGPGEGGAVKPDVTAPGEGIIAARASGTNMGGSGWTNGVVDPTNYIGAQGTSMSCPHVAGIAAVLRQANSDTTTGDIRNAMRESAPHSNNPDNNRGCGMVDAKEALDLIGNSPRITSIRANGENALGNIPDVFEDQIVEFSATATDDKALPSGSYKWDFDTRVDSDGDGDKLNDVDATGSSSSHVYTKQGLKTVVLTVTDTDNFKTVEYCYIQVNNVAPSGDIVAPNTVYEAEEASFSGSITDSQSDMSSLGWFWDFDGNVDMPYDGINVWSGDGVADNDRMTEGTGATPSGTYTYLEGGGKRIVLAVWDDDEEMVVLDADITVKNVKPTAVGRLGDKMEPDALYEDEPLVFDASDSTDTENDLPSLKYKWDFGDTEDTDWSDEPTVEHSYSQMGNYIVILKVKDDDGDGGTDTFDITILNKPPEAIIGDFLSYYGEGDIILLSGSNSTDTPGDLGTLEYYWDLDSGTDLEDDGDSDSWWDDDGIPDNDRELEGELQEFPYENNGTYEISLIVVDNNGDTNIATSSIFIKNTIPQDVSLIAMHQGAARTEAFEIEEGDRVDFLADADDVAGDLGILNFTWNFGDGDFEFGKEVAHTFMKSADEAYRVDLIVRDDDNEDTAGSDILIYVKNVPPTLELGSDVTITDNGTLVLAGKIKDTGVDEETMKYRWCVLEGSGIPDFNDPTSTDRELNYEIELDGEYEVHLRIEDDNGEWAKDSLTVTASNINPDLDYDSDRMNNRYEIRMGFNPREQDSHLDRDSDGYTNLEEFYAGTDPTDPKDHPEEEGEGITGKLLWMIIAAAVIMLLVIMIVIKVRRRRQEKRNLERVFREPRYKAQEKVKEPPERKKEKEEEKSFDYLSGEMGLRTKGKKTKTPRTAEDIYREKKTGHNGGDVIVDADFSEEDLSYFDGIEPETEGEVPLPEEQYYLPELEAEEDLGEEYPGSDESGALETRDAEDGRYRKASGDDFWKELDSYDAGDRKTAMDDLFSLSGKPGGTKADASTKGRATMRATMKPVSAGKRLPQMKPIKGDMPRMKPLPSEKKATITALKPLGTDERTEKRKAAAPDANVYHGAEQEKRIKELPYRVEVVLPEDRQEEELEPALELDFKLPSSYKKKNGKKGKDRKVKDVKPLATEVKAQAVSEAAADGALLCKHCSSEVKKGWWLCPNCKKKI